jgi:NTP pyrophosphatase (non-canonical NTP hydrolase)
MPRKKAPSSVVDALDVYLSGLRLGAAEEPLAALARLLAVSLEEAPGYARAKLAKELRDVLGQVGAQLKEAEREAERAADLAERRERRARSRAWVADAS